MPRVLTTQERDKLINAPDWRSSKGKRDRALLSILAFGGLRISEACNLTRDNIVVDGERMRLTFTGKGGYTRTVSLPSQAVSTLGQYLKTHTSLFVFPGQSGAMTRRTGHRIVERWANIAGLPEWVHPHTLRHTFGSQVMRKTHDLFLTARVMGHRRIDTTAEYYLAFDSSYADEAAEVFE